jgi:ribonuclease HIII
MNKEDLFALIKARLTALDFKVNPYREIQYGLQFVVFHGDLSGMIRIYQGKKGVRVDLSQMDTGSVLFATIQTALDSVRSQIAPIPTERVEMDRAPAPTGDPDDVIGVDESGKGDYFGPLCIAGVFVNPELTATLQALGVKDSKQLTGKQIISLNPAIQEACPYTVVVLNNLVYNDVYGKFPNLNNILAWGHGRVIENMVGQVKCPHVLCDQFGHQSLIQNALILRGIDVTLLQRHRAEDNIAVAAASILARAAYLKSMDELQDKYKMKFPRGCPPEAYAVRAQFIEKFGEERLGEVAKLHFKIKD